MDGKKVKIILTPEEKKIRSRAYFKKWYEEKGKYNEDYKERKRIRDKANRPLSKRALLEAELNKYKSTFGNLPE